MDPSVETCATRLFDAGVDHAFPCRVELHPKRSVVARAQEVVDHAELPYPRVRAFSMWLPPPSSARTWAGVRARSARCSTARSASLSRVSRSPRADADLKRSGLNFGPPRDFSRANSAMAKAT